MSEGGEVPKLTKEQAIKLEAEKYADSIDRRGCSFWRGLNMGHASGATSENERLSAEIERLKKSNKALYRIAQQKLYETEVHDPEFANIRDVIIDAESLLK